MVTINAALVLDIDVSTHAQSVYMNHNYMRLHRGGSRIAKDGNCYMVMEYAWAGRYVPGESVKGELGCEVRKAKYHLCNKALLMSHQSNQEWYLNVDESSKHPRLKH